MPLCRLLNTAPMVLASIASLTCASMGCSTGAKSAKRWGPVLQKAVLPGAVVQNYKIQK
jgi:hypothetical protein